MIFINLTPKISRPLPPMGFEKPANPGGNGLAWIEKLEVFMTIKDYQKILIEMCRECKTQGPLRDTFLNTDGTPNEKARKIGEELNQLGGFKAMQEAAYAVDDMPDRVGGDARLLEVCWDGIGSWLS